MHHRQQGGGKSEIRNPNPKEIRSPLFPRAIAIYVKIATFNVNGIRSRLGNLLEWLQRETPDVVCLQELKADDNAFPALALRSAGYGAVWHGQKSWNGVAILARDANPIETRRGLPHSDDDSHCRYIEASVNGILVGSLYLPNGNPQP